MISEKQLEANRRNAANSTGPQTPEGKERVRRNSLVHGLTAEVLLPSVESESDFNALREALESEFDPSTPTEQMLVEDLAASRLRLERARKMEAGFFENGLATMKETWPGDDPPPDGHRGLAQVIVRDANNADAHARISRYETSHE